MNKFNLKDFHLEDFVLAFYKDIEKAAKEGKGYTLHFDSNDVKVIAAEIKKIHNIEIY